MANKQREAEANELRMVSEGFRASLRNLYETEKHLRSVGDQEGLGIVDEVIRLLLPQSEHYRDLAYRGEVEDGTGEPVIPLGEQHGRE